MNVPEHRLRSVVFLVSNGEPFATGFLVGVLDENVMFPYVVTARHCVTGMAGRDFQVRINLGDGADDLTTRTEDWINHETADVAAILFEGRPNVHYDLRVEHPGLFVEADYAISAESLWTGDPVPPGMNTLSFMGRYDLSKGEYIPQARLEVAVGDDVFFVSLLYRQPGETKNLPIARFGHVSRMPEEPIVMAEPGGTYARHRAYLVECHSWGGHSGSPVFWCYPMTRMLVGPKVDDQQMYVPTTAWSIRLVGLVSGHWDIEQEARVEPPPQSGEEASIRTAINSGIAVVTPADAVHELLMREDVVRERKKLGDEFREREKRDRAMSPDSGYVESESEYERFESLARQIVNTPKPNKPKESEG